MCVTISVKVQLINTIVVIGYTCNAIVLYKHHIKLDGKNTKNGNKFANGNMIDFPFFFNPDNTSNVCIATVIIAPIMAIIAIVSNLVIFSIIFKYSLVVIIEANIPGENNGW